MLVSSSWFFLFSPSSTSLSSPGEPSEEMDTSLQMHPRRARTMLAEMDPIRSSVTRACTERAEMPTMRGELRA